MQELLRFATQEEILGCGTCSHKELPVRSTLAEDREFKAISTHHCDFGGDCFSAIVETPVALCSSTEDGNSARNLGLNPNESIVAQETVKARSIISGVLVALLWLPVTMMLLTLAHGFWVPLDPKNWLSLWPTIFAGLPLAAACWLIYKHGNGRAAIITFLLAGVVTVLAAIIGGLGGPIGIFAFSAVASVPAWAVWITILAVKKIKSRRK